MNKIGETVERELIRRLTSYIDASSLSNTDHWRMSKLKREAVAYLEGKAARCVAVPQEIADAMLAVCYQPGGYKEIAHINYCRWCSYAYGHPHGDKCPMRLLDGR